MVGGAKYRVSGWLDCSGFVCVMFRLNFMIALMGEPAIVGFVK